MAYLLILKAVAQFTIYIRARKHVDRYVQAALQSPLTAGDEKSSNGGKIRFVPLEELIKQFQDALQIRSHLLNVL
jgi:hypothetical protein